MSGLKNGTCGEFEMSIQMRIAGPYFEQTSLTALPDRGRTGETEARRYHLLPVRDLDVRLELGLQESVRRAGEAGYGVTFISPTAVEAGLAAGRLSEACVGGLEATREISLASAAGRARTRVAEAFVIFARERLAA